MVTTKLRTVEDLWNLSSGDTDYELIEGELFEVSPVNSRHAVAQLKIGSRILAFVEANRLGTVGTEEGFIFQRSPDTVLAPDVAYISKEQVAPEGKFWSDVPPDLAVEVLSPGNTRSDIDRKLRIYLSSGVQLVWIVRPDARNITIHLPGSPPQVLTENDTLNGGDVLPGFEVPVAEIYGG